MPTSKNWLSEVAKDSTKGSGLLGSVARRWRREMQAPQDACVLLAHQHLGIAYLECSFCDWPHSFGHCTGSILVQRIRCKLHVHQPTVPRFGASQLVVEAKHGVGGR